MSEGRGRKRSVRDLATSDLDLLPMMNVFLVVIPVLIVSAVLLEVAVIEMNAPATAEAKVEEQDKPIELSVRITDQAFVVEIAGHVYRTVSRNAGSDQSTLAGAAGGDPAWNELSSALAEVVATHPSQKDVRIVPSPTTRYEVIIAVMDVARAQGLSQAGLASQGGG